eukprot:Clim_evm33s147 gene=Clim_evmTU33s147
MVSITEGKLHEQKPMFTNDVHQGVKDLYELRDLFHERNAPEEWGKKWTVVQEACDELCEKLRQSVEAAKGDDKAEFLFLLGKALNVMQEPSEEAVEVLERAVKLNSSLWEAWNELGELHFKRGKITNAQSCFIGGLNYHQNKVSHRNLSMVNRHIAYITVDPAEKLKLFQQSLQAAKDSVRLDVKDGLSWLILGNAHLAMYFEVSRDPSHLKQAQNGYSQAAKDPVQLGNPDLWAHQGLLHRFQGNYEEAVAELQRAKDLEPSNDGMVNNYKSFVEMLQKCTEFQSKQGKLKNKKIEQIVSSIKPSEGSGSIKNLVEGKDVNVVSLSTLGFIPKEETVPQTYTVIDSEKTCAILGLYNASTDLVRMDTKVEITEPDFRSYNFEHCGERFAFEMFHVHLPHAKLRINGKTLHKDAFVAANMGSTLTQ